MAPDLLRLEVGSALLKAIRRKEITVEEGHAAMARLSAATIRLLPSADHADAAFQIAARHGGSLYDAIYVSIARSLDAPVVTNDATLAAVAKAVRVRSFLIAKGLPTSRFQ